MKGLGRTHPGPPYTSQTLGNGVKAQFRRCTRSSMSEIHTANNASPLSVNLKSVHFPVSTAAMTAYMSVHAVRRQAIKASNICLTVGNHLKSKEQNYMYHG